jgi:HK97 family phage portal protein
MAFLSPILNYFRTARKGPPELLKDPGEFLNRWFGSKNSSTGVNVTPEAAMRAAAVFSCVRLLSESVASLPLILYRRVDISGREGKERAKDHPLYHKLHSAPNDEQTSFEWREMKQQHLSLRGNGYSFIDWGRGGKVKNLFPLHPDRMEIRRKTDGSIVYEYRRLSGKTDFFDSDEILH